MTASVEASEAPSLEVIECTAVSEARELPEAPEAPEATEAPEAPVATATEVTEVPEASEAPEAPVATETTEAPEASKAPETPFATEVITIVNINNGSFSNVFNLTGIVSYTISPPATTRLRVLAVNCVELDAMATHHPIPSLAAALMYLRGQELRHLANRTIASQIHI